MKNIFLALLVSFSPLALPAMSSADPADAIEVPMEVSAVLTSPDYSKLMSQQRKIATQSGKSIRVSHLSVLDFGSEKFAYVALATRLSSDFSGEWTAIGSIVANITYGPMGEVSIDGIHYNPQAEGPGGASVGNH